MAEEGAVGSEGEEEGGEGNGGDGVVAVEADVRWEGLRQGSSTSTTGYDGYTHFEDTPDTQRTYTGCRRKVRNQQPPQELDPIDLTPQPPCAPSVRPLPISTPAPQPQTPEKPTRRRAGALPFGFWFPLVRRVGGEGGGEEVDGEEGVGEEPEGGDEQRSCAGGVLAHRGLYYRCLSLRIAYPRLR